MLQNLNFFIKDLIILQKMIQTSTNPQIISSNSNFKSKTIIRTQPTDHSITQTFNKKLDLLVQCIQGLKNQISSLPIKKEENNKEKEKEKFRQTGVSIPSIPKLDTIDGKGLLKEWLGDMTSKVFEAGFKAYEDKKLEYSRAKTFCCENIIYCLMEMINQNNFSIDEIELMNSCLKNDILPYLLYKYPKSHDSQINLKFATLIRKVDNIQNNQNDLVFKSGVKFEYSSTGEYYPQIMKFLKYVIQLPNSEEILFVDGQEKKKSLEDCFYNEMYAIYKKIYNRTEVQKMMEFDKNNPELIEEKKIKENQRSFLNKIFSQKSRKKLKNDEEKEYSDKVHKYTKFQIGRKISKNTSSFTNTEIEEGNMKVKSTSIMRIITKWCEQLESNFQPDNILNREWPFRMQDGSESFIKKTQLDIFVSFLKEESKKIDDLKEKIKINSLKQQKQLSNEDFEDNLEFLQKMEKKVGLTSSIILRDTKYYLLIYLNALIHGLLSAFESFKRMLYSNKKFDEEDKKYIPQPITFKIGDLLRCKCTSKETEIIALYNEIERMSFYHPNLIRIVKIKDKLATQTKNILINFLYKGRMVVEMQLGINSSKSQFIQCSNDFNHFIYELQRASLGPFTELCSIWMASDSMSEFYENKEKQLHFSKNNHECENKWRPEQIQLPFKCGMCGQYFNQLLTPQHHRHCLECKTNICIHCQLQSMTSYEQMRRILPTLPKPKEGEAFQIAKGDEYIEEQLPDFGLVCKLRTKNKEPKFFQKVRKGESTLIITVEKEEAEDQQSYEILSQVNKKSQIKKLFRENVVIKNEALKVSTKTEEDLSLNFFLPILLKEAMEKEKESLSFSRCFLNDDVLKKINQEKNLNLKSVKKVNFMENSIENFSSVIQLFPNAEIIILNYNGVEKVQALRKLSHLKYLSLYNNEVKNISPSIGEWKSLKYLNLSCNRWMQYLPDEICSCFNLHELYLNSTSLKELPEEINSLRHLKVFEAQFSYIQKLPEKFGECKDLQKMSLEMSKLEDFQIQLRWKNLIQLNLKMTKISELPNSITKCLKLRILNLSYCENLTKLPEKFGDCYSLNKLYLTFTKINILPETMQNLRHLQYILINHSSLQQLYPSFSHQKKLQSLCCWKTGIKEIPDNIGVCQRLTKLELGFTDIENLPNSIQKCLKLNKLDLQSTKISEFPPSLKGLKQLKELNLSSCKIRQLPDWFGDYPRLQVLNVENLQLKKLPQNFTSLIHLTSLSLGRNSFEAMPQEIFYLEKLQYLYFNNNLLKKVNQKIEHLTSLKKLYLENNSFSVLPGKLERLANLKLLKVDKNIEVPQIDDLTVVKI